MLKSTEEEIEEVREYFEWQAPDLEVTFMQKVYSESVLNTRHDVWDIHTNKDRWWVITARHEPLLSGAVPKYGPCSDLPYLLDAAHPTYGATNRKAIYAYSRSVPSSRGWKKLAPP
jgi:hypothetical protein